MSWFHAGLNADNIDTILNPDQVTDVQRGTDKDRQVFVNVWVVTGGAAVRRILFRGDAANAVWQWALQQTASDAALGEAVSPATDALAASNTVTDESSIAAAAEAGRQAAQNARGAIKLKR